MGRATGMAKAYKAWQTRQRQPGKAMGSLSIQIEEIVSDRGLVDLLKNIHLVLLGFIEILFDLNQIETLMSSRLRVLTKES